MKHIFYINPAAGSKNAPLTLIPEIRRACEEASVDYSVHVTSTASEMLDSIRREAANETPFRVYACGGDGTLNRALHGVAGVTHAELAHIPCGTGNDFVRNFTHPAYFLDIRRQLCGKAIQLDAIRIGDPAGDATGDAIRIGDPAGDSISNPAGDAISIGDPAGGSTSNPAGDAIRIGDPAGDATGDAISIGGPAGDSISDAAVDSISDPAGDSLALNMVNIGVDSDVVALAGRLKRYPFLKGSLAYGAAAIRVLMQGKTYRMHIEFDDGTTSEEDLFLIGIANGRFCGGGFLSAPRASLTDGLLDICAIRPVRGVKEAKLLATYRKGTHLDNPAYANDIIYRRCKELQIEARDPVTMAVDGEVVELKRVTLRILPGAVRFSIPQGAATINA